MGNSENLDSWEDIRRGVVDVEHLISQKQFNESMVKSLQVLELMVKSLAEKACIIDTDMMSMIDQLYQNRWISKPTCEHYHRIRTIGTKAQNDGSSNAYDASQAYQLLSQEVYTFANEFYKVKKKKSILQTGSRAAAKNTPAARNAIGARLEASQETPAPPAGSPASSAPKAEEPSAPENAGNETPRQPFAVKGIFRGKLSRPEESSEEDFREDLQAPEEEIGDEFSISPEPEDEETGFPENSFEEDSFQENDLPEDSVPKEDFPEDSAGLSPLSPDNWEDFDEIDVDAEREETPVDDGYPRLSPYGTENRSPERIIRIPNPGAQDEKNPRSLAAAASGRESRRISAPRATGSYSAPVRRPAVSKRRRSFRIEDLLKILIPIAAIILLLIIISQLRPDRHPVPTVPSGETEITESSAIETESGAEESSAEETAEASTAPETEPETTAAPETEPETTAAPETEPETTAAPETEPETTTAPETEPETTAAPETEPETTAAPETEPETTAAPETEPEASYITTTELYVRPQPSSDSGTLGVLAAHAPVQYVRAYNETWAVIIFEGQEAYVSSRYLTKQ